MTPSHTATTNLKRKDVRLKHASARSRWRPLMIAFGLIAAWLTLHFYTARFFHDTHAPLLYPLWLLVTSRHQWAFVVGIALAIIALHIQALQRVRWGWALLSGLFHVVLLAVAFLFSNPMDATTHQQTLATGPHTYQLVHTQHVSWGWGHQSYVVLECDPTGMICRYDGTPYTRYNPCFETDGMLFLDPTTQKLMLSVAQDTFHEFYEVGLPDTPLREPCPVRGLSR